MTLKQAIARWLAPEMAREANKYFWLSNQLGDAQRWLSEFDDVRAMIDWLHVQERNHWRTLDEPAVESKWHWNIAQFREQLRARKAPSTPDTLGDKP